MSHKQEVEILMVRELVDLACVMCEEENLTGLRTVLDKLKPRAESLVRNLVKEEKVEEILAEKIKKHK